MVTSNSAKTGDGLNPYEINALGVLQLYGQFIEGDAESTLAIVSNGALSQRARAAIEASAERLGLGADACAWIDLSGGEVEATLGAHDLLTLIEGIDPLAIVATDATAVSLVSKAYEAPMKMDAANRAACRTVVALSDFEAALDDSEAKQKAWRALKKITR